jgi:hypothetical protein
MRNTASPAAVGMDFGMRVSQLLYKSLVNSVRVHMESAAKGRRALERVDHWERIASRGRPAFSSHLINSVLVNVNQAKRARSPVRGHDR